MRSVAFTVKGLEDIAEKELQTLEGVVKVVQKGDKFILFDYEGSIDTLTELRTVDDIGVFVGMLDHLDPIELIDLNLLPQAIKAIGSVRAINNSFSVTTSIVSVEVDKEALITRLVEELAAKGLIHTPEDRTNLDFRIFLNKEVGFLAIRLTKDPLYKRDYENGNYPGALKSTIAAAMVLVAKEKLTAVAQISRDVRVVDSFCGSGTILCEAYLKGFQVYGGDINSDAVKLTRQRLKLLGSKVPGNINIENIKIQDATRTKWNAKYFDCAISNLPWDKQHEISGITALYANTVKEYRRILKPGFVLCIICHKPELLVKFIKKEFGDVFIERFDLGYLGQTPSIVLVTRGL